MGAGGGARSTLFTYNWPSNTGARSAAKAIYCSIFCRYNVFFSVISTQEYKLEDYFLEFLKASMADLITLLFSSLQNSEGCGDGDNGESCADPCQFLPFRKTKN